MPIRSIYVRYRSFLALGLALLTIRLCAAAASTPTDPKKDDNLDACIRGLAVCDISRLAPADISKIAANYRAKNRESRQSGANSCDPTLLGDEDLKAFHAAAARRNLDRCMEGASSCDPAMLNEEHARSVGAFHRKRNFDDCLAGRLVCDTTLLNHEEAAAAIKAARARNFEFCMSGSSRCDPLVLNAQEDASLSLRPENAGISMPARRARRCATRWRWTGEKRSGFMPPRTSATCSAVLPDRPGAIHICSTRARRARLPTLATRGI